MNNRLMTAAVVLALMGCRSGKTVQSEQRTQRVEVAGSRETVHRWDMDSLLARMSVSMDSMTVTIIPPDTLQPTVIVQARRGQIQAEAERTVQSVQTSVRQDTATVAATHESEAKEVRKPRIPRWLFVTICVLAASLLIQFMKFVDVRKK